MLPDESRYRTFWERFIASLLDGCVLMPITVPTTFIVGYAPGWLAAAWVILAAPVPWIYTSYCHGRWGQTIGKRAMKIAVARADDLGLPGYARAIRRDAGTIVFSAAGAVMMLALVASGDVASFRTFDVPDYSPPPAGAEYSTREILRDAYSDAFAGWSPWMFVLTALSLAWSILELATMLSNRRRRALHDYIGGTVVIRLTA